MDGWAAFRGDRTMMHNVRIIRIYSLLISVSIDTAGFSAARTASRGGPVRGVEHGTTFRV
jgi:hypothetical protein